MTFWDERRANSDGSTASIAQLVPLAQAVPLAHTVRLADAHKLCGWGGT